MIAIIVTVIVNANMLGVEEERLKTAILKKLVNGVEAARNLQNIQVLICRNENMPGNNVRIEAYYSNDGLKDVSSKYKIAMSGVMVGLGLNPLSVIMREISGYTHLTFPEYQEAKVSGSENFGQ